jgi:hypothetical protein
MMGMIWWFQNGKTPVGRRLTCSYLGEILSKDYQKVKDYFARWIGIVLLGLAYGYQGYAGANQGYSGPAARADFLA